jgi:hypothetical protein
MMKNAEEAKEADRNLPDFVVGKSPAKFIAVNCFEFIDCLALKSLRCLHIGEYNSSTGGEQAGNVASGDMVAVLEVVTGLGKWEMSRSTDALNAETKCG